MVATGLLEPLWRGIDTDYKARYARNIWEQFEHAVRSASYTSRLDHFLQRITSRLRIAVRADDAKRLAGIVGGGEDRAILRMLREETAYMVLLVRVSNEERQEARKAGAL